MVSSATSDFHSRATRSPPQQTGTPRWHRFLYDTFGDDAEGQEMIDFLHLLLGYSITGDVGGQVPAPEARERGDLVSFLTAGDGT